MAKDVIARLKAQDDGWNSGFERAMQPIANLRREILSLNSMAGGMAKGLAGLAMSVAGPTAAFGALTSAVSYNIRTAKKFEQSVAGLQALTGMSGKDLDYLKQKAIELGGSTTQTASQVAESFMLIGSKMPELLKDADALKKVTEASIRLAEASGGDVTTSANALTAALNIMGEGANEATRYINVMAAASQHGTRNIQELTDIVFRAGQNARATGISFEELMAISGAGTKEFASAEHAGQALSKLFLQLEKQSDNNLKPSVVGVTEAIKNLTAANFDTVTATKMFTKNGAAAYMSIIHNKDAILELLPNIKGTNTATEQASTNTNTLSGSLNKLESAWEEFNLTMNDSNGILKDAVDLLTDAISGCTNFSKSLDDNRTSFRTWVADVSEDLHKMNGTLGDVWDSAMGAFKGISTSQWNKTAAPDIVTGAAMKAVPEVKEKPKLVDEATQFDDRTEEGIKAHIKYLNDLRATADIAGQEYANLTAEITRLQGLMGKTTKPKELIKPFDVKDVEARDFGNMEYSLTELKNLLSYWQNVADTTRDTMERSRAQGEAQSIQKKIEVFDITPSEEAMSDFRDKVQQMMASLPPLEVEVSGNKTAKFAKETADAWSAASHAISNAGSAMAQLEDPATKVAGIIMQAVANVALGFAQALASPATGAAGIFGWIAAATAGIATMTATIASIKSATAYHAEGGVVGATSLSRGSDVVPAMLTPGEVVLNYSQQANLANSLQNRNEGVQYGGRSTISGEQIVTVVNAYGRRTGRGEILR